MFEKWRHTAAEGARKHPMWAGTVTPANIWRMWEDINALASEVEVMKEKIGKMEELFDSWKRDYIRQCWEYAYNGTDFPQVVRKMIDDYYQEERNNE